MTVLLIECIIKNYNQHTICHFRQMKEVIAYNSARFIYNTNEWNKFEGKGTIIITYICVNLSIFID